MVVYYKFKSAKDYDTIPMKAHFISIKDLKTKIFESKYLSKHGTDIDIVISNAQTGEEFINNTDLVPRHASLIVRRVAGNPRLRKRAKIQLRENNLIKMNQNTGTDGKSITSQMQQCDETAKELEEEDFGGDVYAVLPHQSQVLNIMPTRDEAIYHEGKLTKNPNKAPADTSFKPCDSSKFMHSQCISGVKEVAPTIHSRVSGGLQIPAELNCPICKKIMKDAVLLGKCCFNSYCRECITEYLKSNMGTCLCGKDNVSVERDLILNKTLQDTIHRFSHIDAVDTSVSVSTVTSTNDQQKARTINHQLSASKRPRPGFPIIEGKNLIPRPGYVCRICHIPGHFIHNCPMPSKQPAFFRTKNFKRPVAELYKRIPT